MVINLLLIVMVSTFLTFKLNTDFIDRVKTWNDPFDNNPLGKLVYKRTYSRMKEDDTNEVWYETIQRVVEGTYSIIKERIQFLGKDWNETRAQRDAQEMYELMFNMYFLPPGRGLWCMGTDVIHKKKLGMALNNCAFISTENILENPTRPFEVLADMSMCGTGVGFDTAGADQLPIFQPQMAIRKEIFVVPDTREGWVESIGILLNTYFEDNSNTIDFDYSKIRKKGERLVTFGGVSSGPDPLIKLHNEIDKVFEREFEKQKDSSQPKLSSTGIVDICNLIGVCVVSGGIRRTALIAFGKSDDEDFSKLKDYQTNPHRAEFGWTSNNSIFAEIGQSYLSVQQQIIKNGEPGIALLANMQKYDRMCDPPTWKDRRAKGGNPCLEQTLEANEVCCLVENFIARCEHLKKFLRVFKYSFLYAKAVTLMMTHIPETNAVISANRRIGCSLSGIAQFLGKNNIEDLRIWSDEGYKTIKHWDKIYSAWFDIPESIKITSIKPSGTVSLLAGATPGIHFPNSTYYKRRVRMTTGSPLIDELKKEGYYMEPCKFTPDHTQIVEFPINVGKCKTLDDVTMFEQLELAAFMQHWYADNQVSCTVTFRPEEGQYIAAALNTYQYRLKGISLLPRCDDVYPQMPYEKITEDQYHEELLLIEARKRDVVQPPSKRRRTEDPHPTAFCDGETCTLNL